MKYIKEFNQFNPKLNKEVYDYVQDVKYRLPELWDNDLTEEENEEFLIDYFKEFPNEMNSINFDKIKKASQNYSNPLSKKSPQLQNLGGTVDFRGF
jgi:hypothetical protein